MTFTIDVDLIENDEVQLTENGNGNLEITHVPSGDSLIIDSSAALSNIGVDAEDNGTVTVSNSSSFNFGSNLSVTDDGDGTVTIDVSGSLGSFSDDDSDSVAELGSSFDAAEIADDKELYYGTDGNDTSVRYDSTNDDLRIKDEGNNADRVAIDRTTGDVDIEGTLTEGKNL